MRVRFAGFSRDRGAFGEAGILPAPAQNADGGPRGNNESDGQRPEHGGAGPDGNGPHVRPHQAADERHRQHGRDHSEGSEDGRVADFVDRLDGDRRPGAALVVGQVEVADDVLDDDDGVVHQDADGEDQGKESDAVERVAVEVEHEQREGQRAGDGDAHDE